MTGEGGEVKRTRGKEASIKSKLRGGLSYAADATFVEKILKEVIGICFGMTEKTSGEHQS